MNIFEFFTPKQETFFLRSDATIRQALEKFDHYKFSVVPLLDENGFYVTTVSEGDILRYMKNEAHFDVRKAENVRVLEIERYRPCQACRADVPLETVMKLALEQNFIPIVDDRGAYIGILKRKAILRAFYEKWNAEE